MVILNKHTDIDIKPCTMLDEMAKISTRRI